MEGDGGGERVQVLRLREFLAEMLVPIRVFFSILLFDLIKLFNPNLHPFRDFFYPQFEDFSNIYFYNACISCEMILKILEQLLQLLPNFLDFTDRVESVKAESLHEIWYFT